MAVFSRLITYSSPMGFLVPPAGGEHRTQVNQAYTDTKAKSAVAATLPFEILQLIFLLALPLSDLSISTFQYEYALGPLQSREPLSYTYVCSRWRSVALNIPELWSSLSATQYSTRMTCGVIKIWLQNAKTSLDNRTENVTAEEKSRLAKVHALNLHLAQPSRRVVDQGVSRYNLRAFLCFWQDISRCRSINLRMDRKMLLHFQDSFVLDAPLLEDVEIYFQTGSIRGLKSVVSWLRRLPALRRLYLNFPFECTWANLCQLPFDTLEEVFLAVDLDFEGAVMALVGCLSVNKVQFKNMLLSGRRPSIIDNRTILHHLTSLVLDGHGDPAALLDYVTLPALKVLVLRSTTLKSITSPLRCLENFLERSHCALDKLVVHSKKSDSVSALSILQIEAIRPIPIVDVHFALDSQTNEHVLQGYLASFELFAQAGFKNLRVLRRNGEEKGAYHVGWGMEAGPEAIIVYEHGMQLGSKPPLSAVDAPSALTPTAAVDLEWLLKLAALGKPERRRLMVGRIWEFPYHQHGHGSSLY